MGKHIWQICFAALSHLLYAHLKDVAFDFYIGYPLKG